MNKEVYEVWATEFDACDRVSDFSVFLGAFDTPEKAIELAGQIFCMSQIYGKENAIQKEEAGCYLSLSVRVIYYDLNKRDTIWTTILKQA